MKKGFIYTVVLFIAALTGCEDFLDCPSNDKLEYGRYYRNAAEVNTGVLACYNGIHGPLDREFFLTEIRSDNARNYRQNDVNGTELDLVNMDIYQVDPSSDINTLYWERTYHNIANCNSVMEHLDVVEVPALRQQYEGEVRFIRAYHYFNLVRLYGAVFLVTERITPEEAKYTERSTVDVVYGQIREDLEFAASKLPVGNTSDQKGRIDRWGAKTLLAKVYLTLAGSENDRPKAKQLLTDAWTLLKEVEKDGGYDLVKTSYADVFSVSNEMNEEILFASRYKAGGYGLGSPFGNYFAPGNSGNMIITGGGSGYNCPTEDLLAAFKKENDEQAGIMDNRKAAVLEETWTKVTDSGTKTVNYLSYVTKYLSEILTSKDAENDWPIIRYADVLLMLGEIENELNGPTQTAVDYLNYTRMRAGLKAKKVEDFKDKYEFQDAMLTERRLEFAFENQRFFDLQRTGQLPIVMKNHFETEKVRSIQNGNYAKEGFYDAPRFTTIYMPDKSLENWQLLLPIPYKVMMSAPNATQNVGY